MIPIDVPLTTAYLKEMVQINSINPGLSQGGAGEGAVAGWLSRTCKELGLDVRLQETAPGRSNVLARWPGSGGGKSLLLTGHTDVVGVENMTGNPFDARVENGRLYGRGALDMKGGLASILGAVAALRAMAFQPAGDLWLGFVTDEEYKSSGTEMMVQEIRPDAAILTEPTGLQICIAHKGFAWLSLNTIGRSAHGSLYNAGVDAIVNMGRLLARLECLEHDRLPGREHPLLGRSSVHASTITGGVGWSTYPDRCELRIEHRLLPDEKAESTLAWWRETLAELAAADPQFRAEVQLDFARPGYEIAPDAPIVRALDGAYSRTTGEAPIYMGMPAWLDSAILGREGIPTVIFGPGGEGAHAAVEYVNLDEVFRCAAVLAEAATGWTGAAS
ncbi:MAG: ArgE/DapE family deacylase [Chloroflexi bacterium]|nr:ArgE/DapE family deacylase [Chloroflexota bacterium]